MIEFKNKLTGFDEFEKKLALLPVKLERKILQAAVSGAMKEAKRVIKAAAPAHADQQQSAPSKKYGTLKKNIRLMKLKRVRKGEKGARVSTGDAFWGYIYEFGSRYQPARPWFTPAFRGVADRMIQLLGQQLGAGLEKIAQEK